MFNNELKQLALDVANNKVKATDYSAKDGSEVIRQAMIEALGTDKLDYKTFRRAPHQLFEFIEETITPNVHRRLEETFYQFAEFRNIPYGDQNKFLVPNTDLFRVATIAEGSGNIRRKRLESAEFDVEISSIAVGVYEEFNRFLAGRVDWAMYISKLEDSFTQDLAIRISNALYGSFDTLGDLYKSTVSAPDADAKEELMAIVDHVEAEHGQAVVLGTRQALRGLKPEFYSDAQAGARNNNGYFGTVDGVDLIAIPQFHLNGTDEFAVDNDTLLVLPTAGEKLVKVVIEGNAIVRQRAGLEDSRDDFQMQYDVIQRVGVLAMTPNKYGMLKLS